MRTQFESIVKTSKQGLKFRAWDLKLNKMIYDEPCNILQWFSNPNDGVIMQYTGLKDKLGTEIFVGDLLSVGWLHTKFKVSFKNGTFLMGLVPLYFNYKQVLIVGNIYESCN